MTKKIQHLEPLFSKSLSFRSDLFYMKLQVNPMAHTCTPADYFVMNKQGASIFIECKECNLNANNKGRYEFKRLTQFFYLSKLDDFSKYSKSYVCIMIWNKRLKNSLVYLIPFSYYNMTYRHYINDLNKKSLTFKDLEENFSKFKLKIDKNILILPF